MNTKHSKNIMKNNPVQQHIDGSLSFEIEMVIRKTRTTSEAAPTLIRLLQNGAKWDRADLLRPGTTTPYHVICRGTGDHHELLELMIKELGWTLVNTKDHEDCTALMHAVQNANIKCVKSLISNGADVNLISHEYKLRCKPDVADPVSPLIDSINLLHPKSQHSSNIMLDIFDLLLNSGADVNQPCVYHIRSPIMYAAAVGNVKCVKKLIENGAQINHTDTAGHTVWTVAAESGSVDVLKYLLEDIGIDKNSIGGHGLNVLNWAVRSGNIEAVRYLLHLGVTVTSFIPQKGMEACKYCGTNLSSHYINVGQLNTDPYMFAIRCNMPDIVRLMDEYGCELHKSPEILSYAIRMNSVDVVDYLLCNHKYPLNYDYTDNYIDSSVTIDHQTFLSKALDTQSVEVVKLLLEHGADPNKKCCAETFPSVINEAIHDRLVEIVARFIRGGVIVNVRSCSHYLGIGTMLPFEVAVFENHICTAEMLLISGCSCGVHNLDAKHKLKADLEPEMQELLKRWNVHKNNVLPLQQRCRMVILNHLSPQADKKIRELPLPPMLINYLSIPELDDIVETFKGKQQTDDYVG